MKNLNMFLFVAFLSSSVLAQLKPISKPIVQQFQYSNSKVSHSPQLRSAQAAASTIFCEDFANGLDGNNEFGAWTTSGPDGDIWLYDNDGSDGQFSDPNNTYLLTSETANNGWMIFDGDLSNPGSVQAQFQQRRGQLVSPYIDLSDEENVSLQFQHAFRWCCTTEFEMIVSVSNDNGANWTDYNLNESATVNALAETRETNIIISDVAGGEDSVLIRFDWGGNANQSATHYFWMIDDVQIVQTPDDFSFLSDEFVRTPSSLFGGTSYINMPLAQASQTQYIFGGSIENLGVNELQNLKLIGLIDSENYTGESGTVNLSSEDKDTLFCNQGFIPQNVGQYVGQIYGVDDNGISTDTTALGFDISEYDYARDFSDYNDNYNTFDVNDEGTYQVGNIFDIYADATIYAIRIYIDPTTHVDAEAKVVLLSVPSNGGNPNFLTQTETINVGQSRGQWMNFELNSGPYDVFAGDIIMPAIYAEGPTDKLVAIGVSGISSPGEVQLQDIEGAQGEANLWYYTTRTPMIRLSFDPDIITNTSTIENQNGILLSVYPNPNKGQFNLELQLTNQSNIDLSINNIIGQEVYRKPLGNQLNYKEKINVSFLESGVYFLNIYEDKNLLQTKKIIVK